MAWLNPFTKIKSATNLPNGDETQNSNDMLTTQSYKDLTQNNGNNISSIKRNDNDNDIKNETKNNNDNDNSIDLLKVGMKSFKQIEIKKFYMDEDNCEKYSQKMCWSNCSAETFKVRIGPDYTPGKKKESLKSLYKVFAVDGYKTQTKLKHMCDYINIDDECNRIIKKYDLKYHSKYCPLPPILMVSWQVPDYLPEISRTVQDGEGYTIIVYAELSEDVVLYMKNNKYNEWSNSIKLASNFFHSNLINSELRNRFKAIARIMNLKYTTFSYLTKKLISNYNSKPFLCRTSSTFKHVVGRYFYADIDVHTFGYPAKRGYASVKDCIESCVFDLGIVIEGQKNNELPEQILLCVRMFKPSFKQTKQFPIKLYNKILKQKKIINIQYIKYYNQNYDKIYKLNLDIIKKLNKQNDTYFIKQKCYDNNISNGISN